MTPIVLYLKDERLPEDKDEAKKLRIRATKYVIIDEVLYKQGFSQPYLRCLAPDESNYVFREDHETWMARLRYMQEELELKYVAHLQYQTTNNEAEYETLLKGLELAKSIGAELVIIQGNSLLIINQVNGICEAKEDWMKKYLNKVK